MIMTYRTLNCVVDRLKCYNFSKFNYGGRKVMRKKITKIAIKCSEPKKLDFYGVEKPTPFLYDKINY